MTKTTTTKTWTLVLMATMLSAAVACGGVEVGGEPEVSEPIGSGEVTTEEEQALVASEAIENAASASAEAALMAALVEGAESASTPFEAARLIVEAAPETWSPPECVEATQEGNTATITFEGCSGPYGVAEVNGTVIATYAVTLQSLSASVHTEGLSIGNTDLSLSADLVYRADRAGEELIVTSEVEVSSDALGKAISRSGATTISFDAETDCVALDSETTTSGALNTEWTTTIDGLAHCAGACPEAGGSITYSNGRGTDISVTFEGDSVSWSASTNRGERSGELPLTCE